MHRVTFLIAGLCLITTLMPTAGYGVVTSQRNTVQYGPNIRLEGSAHQIRQLRYWLDEIARVPKGLRTLKVITQAPHQLTIRHATHAIISAGRTSASMSENLTNGVGADVVISFNANIPDHGSHSAINSRRQPIEYTAVQNLYHELAHAMHMMAGTWLYFKSERQAIAEENQFRQDLARQRGVTANERFRVTGVPDCSTRSGRVLASWQRLICKTP